MTKADKAKYVDNHFEECLESARASEMKSWLLL